MTLLSLFQLSFCLAEDATHSDEKHGLFPQNETVVFTFVHFHETILNST